jgi:hypothetical protein
MPRLHAKSFRRPDDVRVRPTVRFETVGPDGATVGHCSFGPGWRDEALLSSTTPGLIEVSGIAVEDAGSHELSGAVRVPAGLPAERPVEA